MLAFLRLEANDRLDLLVSIALPSLVPLLRAPTPGVCVPGSLLSSGPTTRPLFAFKPAAPHLPPFPAPPSPGTHLARLRVVAPLGQVMSLHLHRAQHPPGLRPHTPRLQPPRGTESSGLSAGTGPELRTEARSPGVPLAQAPWEAVTFYSRDTPALARPGLSSHLP